MNVRPPCASTDFFNFSETRACSWNQRHKEQADSVLYALQHIASSPLVVLQHTIQHATMLYSLHQMLQYYIAQLYFLLIFEPLRVDPITGAAAGCQPTPRPGPKMLKTRSYTKICIQDGVWYYSVVYYIACIASPDAIDAICYRTSKSSPRSSSRIRQPPAHIYRNIQRDIQTYTDRKRQIGT